jgi:hypothetical protein
MTSVLFLLPVDVVVVVLRDWIGIKLLGRLDSATCLHGVRPHLLAIFRATTFVHVTMYPTDCKEKTTSHVQWLTNRAVKVKRWRVGHAVNPCLVKRLIEATGGLHVCSLRLKGLSEGALQPIFHSLLGAGNNVTRVSLTRCFGGRIMNNSCVTKNLLVLALQECYFPCFAWLGEQCTNLKYLAVDSCTDVCGMDEFVLNCPNLEGVLFSRRNGSWDPSISVVVYIIAEDHGAALKYLSLGNVLDAQIDEALTLVAENCSNLQELQLDRCFDVGKSCLIQLVSSLPMLRELVLEYCAQVTDAVLVAIADHAPHLTALSLFCSIEYSEFGAWALMHSLTELQRFSVTTHNEIFDEDLLEEWTERLPGLQVVYGGFNVSSSGIYK